MKWRKLGRVFVADQNSETMISYGRMPQALHLHGDVFRIYFESRSLAKTASPYFLDLDLKNPEKILRLQTTPLLLNGETGTFDDNGITPFSVLRVGNEIWMYYCGWNLSVKVKFHNAIGLAVSTDGGQTFKKKFLGPVLDRDRFDPFFPTGPLVKFDEGIFKMWYTSFVAWKPQGGELVHYYDIKYRESKDGIDWTSEPKTAIPFANAKEYAFVCRGILKSADKYEMWYCFRAQEGIDTYRIGYAQSADGKTWERRDSEMKSFDVSPGEWDGNMVCYPYVFAHAGRTYMLYNGNGYGQTGFGLAVLESEA